VKKYDLILCPSISIRDNLRLTFLVSAFGMVFVHIPRRVEADRTVNCRGERRFEPAFPFVESSEGMSSSSLVE
jgi:hypothetical protein